MKDKFINLSIEKELSQKKYLKGMIYYNTHTFQSYKMDYDLIQSYKLDYYYLKSIFNDFSLTYKNSIPVFITLTLPSQFHNNSDLVKNGYDLMNSFMRSFFKTLSARKVSYKYIRVLEPHKDFTPHFHILLYLNFDTVENSVYTYSYIRNIFYRLKRKYGLGRTQYKRISGDKGVQKYISKYLAKMFDFNNISFLYALDGWKRFYQMRLVTYSKVDIPKYVFKKLLSLKDLPDLSEIDENDYYQYFKNYCRIDYYYKDNLVYYYNPLKEKKYYVKVTFDDRTVFRGIPPHILRNEINLHFEGSVFSPLVDFWLKKLEKSISSYEVVFNIHGSDIIFYSVSDFLADLVDYCVSVVTYRAVSDIEIYDDDVLLFKKSDNFIERDLRESTFSYTGDNS